MKGGGNGGEGLGRRRRREVTLGQLKACVWEEPGVGICTLRTVELLTIQQHDM